MELLINARKHLQSSQLSTEVLAVDRGEIVAYSTLCAVRDHFPLEITPADLELIKKWQIIKDTEYDRYVKQRRIVLGKIAMEWNQRS